jgi:hypothetical protein
MFATQQGLESAHLAKMLGLSAKIGEYTVIILSALVGCGVYLVTALGLKVSEAQYLQERLLGRFTKKRIR